MAQTVKNLPAMQETQVRSLGWEDPLEEGMAPHSSTRLESPTDSGAWRATVHGGGPQSTATDSFSFGWGACIGMHDSALLL